MITGAAFEISSYVTDQVNSVAEHSETVDVDFHNKAYLWRSEEFWEATESSKWWQEDGEIIGGGEEAKKKS